MCPLPETGGLPSSPARDQDAGARVHVRLLGPAQVKCEGQPKGSPASGKALALLGYLAVRDQPVAREHLADLFWPDKPANRGRANLSWLLHQLAGRLPGCLEADRHLLHFKRAPPYWLDLDAFADLLARGDPPSLAEAVKLYRGDLLDGLHLDDCAGFELWLVGERERWRRRAVRALSDLVAHHGRHGLYREGLRYARRLLALEPWLEEVHGQVMRLLALGGQRAAALAQYEACRRVLAEELGVEPGPQTLQLYEQIRDGELADPALASSPPLPAKRRHNLPSWTTSLVGRGAELAELTGLLCSPGCRILTLVGPPGVGKTRLGVHVASELLGEVDSPFADGLFFVALAPIRDPALVLPAIAQVLGIRQVGSRPLLDALQHYLADKQLLLLLDNFEQVVPAALEVSELLTSAPGMKVLVTSRASLHLYGEHNYPVPPLALPDPKALPPDGALQAEAMQVFDQRARAVKADFTLTGESAPSVAEICIRLDGLPLAIELAAARARLLPPQQMLAQLGSRLRFLTGGPRDVPARYRTLRSTIDWSYDLLGDDERTLFRRLGIFAGGCSLAAAEAVCNASGDIEVPGGLEGLVDQNLARQSEAGGEPRFAMLETLREYAVERLGESQEAEAIPEQHARFFLTLAEEAEPHLIGPEPAAWLDRLEGERDNLRAALAWSTDAGMELGLRLAGALGRFWHLRGYHSEGCKWLAKALAKSEALGTGASQLRAKALNQAGNLAWYQRDITAAYSQHKRSVALWQEVGDEHGLAQALCDFGVAVYSRGDLPRARSLLEESVALFRRTDDIRGSSVALFWHGHLAYIARDYEGARVKAEESMALAQQAGDTDTVAAATSTLGRIAFDQGDHAAAGSFLEQSLALFRETGDEPGTAIALKYLGDASHAQGNHERARTAYMDSLGIWRQVGAKSSVAELLNRLGFVSLHQNRWQQAHSLFAGSLPAYQEAEYRGGMAVCLVGLAGAAQGQEEPELAARLLGMAEALLEANDAHLYSFDQAEYEYIGATVRAQLDGAAFEAARAAGQEMAADDWQQATNWALGIEPA